MSDAIDTIWLITVTIIDSPNKIDSNINNIMYNSAFISMTEGKSDSPQTLA